MHPNATNSTNDVNYVFIITFFKSNAYSSSSQDMIVEVVVMGNMGGGW